jgi:hypothetical protein
MSFTSILLLIFAVLSIASNVIGYIALPKDDASKSRRQFVIFMITVSCILALGALYSTFAPAGTAASLAQKVGLPVSPVAQMAAGVVAAEAASPK